MPRPIRKSTQTFRLLSPIKLQEIRTIIEQRVAHAMQVTVTEMLDKAKEFAPVRQVFNRKKVGKHGNDLFPTFRLRSKSTGKVETFSGDFRAVERERGTGTFRLKDRAAEQFLTATGRHSLASLNRDVFVSVGGKNIRIGAGPGGVDRPSAGSNSQLRLGGKLRREIYAVPPHQDKSGRWEAGIVSPTPYAKFQEDGTRHNKAHPYMRPALHSIRESYRALLVTYLREGASVAKSRLNKSQVGPVDMTEEASAKAFLKSIGQVPEE